MMTESMKQALLDLRARQEASAPMPCPRCGRDSMKPVLLTNALSRHAENVYICDDCGSAEAMLDFMHSPLPLECWAVFRSNAPQEDFKDTPGKEALRVIESEHLPRMLKAWQASGKDFEAFRAALTRDCPGLSQVWEHPFQAVYDVADGEIVARFKRKGDTLQIALDLLTRDK